MLVQGGGWPGKVGGQTSVSRTWVARWCQGFSGAVSSISGGEYW